MYIICLITVTLMGSNGFIDSLKYLEGRLVRQTEFNIIGDFSGDAKRNELFGDYSEVLVPKINCKRSK